MTTCLSFTIWDKLSLSLVWLANSYSSCKTPLRVTSPTKVFSPSPTLPPTCLHLEDSAAQATCCSGPLPGRLRERALTMTAMLLAFSFTVSG